VASEASSTTGEMQVCRSLTKPMAMGPLAKNFI
jgi:hypothetical protein